MRGCGTALPLLSVERDIHKVGATYVADGSRA
jgi:hypothetical protein